MQANVSFAHAERMSGRHWQAKRRNTLETSKSIRSLIILINLLTEK